MITIARTANIVCSLLLGASAVNAAVKEFRIKLDIPPPKDSAGGIVVADLDNDEKPDFLITVPGHIAVYSNSGKKLWVQKTDVRVAPKSETNGLPGHDGPGVAAGDIDADGKAEVVYLTKNGFLHILDGASGKDELHADQPSPDGAAHWELAMIADFRGTGGDTDLLLQTTNREGYRMGRFLAAYSFSDLKKPLWTVLNFQSCAHNGARICDLDGDGKDEVLGAHVVSPEGKVIIEPDRFRGHMDSVFVADVVREKKGLEVVLLEEGSNQVQILGMDGVQWRRHYKNQEPQNAVIGRFKENSDEIFIWCRSRYNQHQKPFVFDSKGRMIFTYEMDKMKPADWTESGVEVIHRIDWTGRRQQLACAKERHESGDICVFEPLSGKFVVHIKSKADRLYVADVRGDWREEIIVLEGNVLRVFENTAKNPRPDEPRLWSNRNYRRLKQCHNYYSP